MNTFQIRTIFPFALRRPIMHFFGLAILAWLFYFQEFRILSVSFSAFTSVALLVLIWSESLKGVEFRADGFSFLDGNRVAAHQLMDMQAIEVRRRFPGTYFLHFKTGTGSLALRYLTPRQYILIADWATAQQIPLSSLSLGSLGYILPLLINWEPHFA